MRRFLPLFVALFIFPSLTLAQGLIIVHDGPVVPHHFPFTPLEVSYHRVTADIQDNVAVTTVDQEFYNPNNRQLEGTYLFPLPAGATIDRFAMDINGHTVQAELLSADKARTIYEDIVRKYRDPALLEYTGRGAFKARIFPIEPNSKKRVQIKYTQIIRPDAGLAEYVYSLNTEKFSAKPLKDVSIKINLQTELPILSVYSPSHEVEMKRESPTRAVIGFEAKDVRADTDFKLIFTQQTDSSANVGVSVLTFRKPGEDGYFLVMASPGLNKDAKPQPKDIAFVIDTSGSMAESGGKKLQQAKKSLTFCLANLNPEDRFNIIRFSTESERFAEDWLPASKDNVARAMKFVEDLRPMGGTAIADALGDLLKLKSTSHDRPGFAVFLTDGQPTIGETSEDKLVSLVKSAPQRIFTFGIGTDINTHLLDRVANDSRAFSQYVLPDEDLELKLSSFYSKIQSPAVTDVKLGLAQSTEAVQDIRLKQIYPDQMPDLFAGQTLLAFGRYSGTGNARVEVRGTRNGQPVTFGVAANFPEKDDTHDYIARLWATRRVGFLLDEIRLRGENSELKDEITKIAREHGIVTPYTSYLIMEDETRRNVPIAARTMRGIEEDRFAREQVRAYYDSAAKNGSGRLELAGQRAVANSAVTQLMKQAQCVAQSTNGLGLQVSAGASPATAPGYKAQNNFTQAVAVRNGKSFYQNGTTWTDAACQRPDRSLRTRQVAFNSDDYFALVRNNPAAAQWLSLGDNVDVVIDDTIYQVRSAGGKS